MPRSALFLVGILLLAVGVHWLLDAMRTGEDWRFGAAMAVAGVVLTAMILFVPAPVVGRISSLAQAATVSPDQVAHEPVLLAQSAQLQQGRLYGLSTVVLTEHHLVVHGRLGARVVGDVLLALLGPLGWVAAMLLSLLGRRVEFAIPYRALPSIDNLLKGDPAPARVQLELPAPGADSPPLVLTVPGAEAPRFLKVLRDAWRAAHSWA